MLQPLDLDEAQYMGYELATKLMQYDEPMPPFETRFPGRLEACIVTPFQTFGGRQLYHRMPRKSAILFYSIIKNHPFLNGNKRMAVMLTLAFFYKNKRWLNVAPHPLYKVACDVATSTPDERDVILDALTIFFGKYTVKR